MVLTTGNDTSNQNFISLFNNFTTVLSTTTDFLSKCTTSTEETQKSLATYIVLFPKIDDYFLAFLMNLTGNLVSMYNVFNQLVAASQTCDYLTMADRIGNLVKRLYNVAPIEAGALETFDVKKTDVYVMMESGF
jgi:hypothetical protein